MKHLWDEVRLIIAYWILGLCVLIMPLNQEGVDFAYHVGKFLKWKLAEAEANKHV